MNGLVSGLILSSSTLGLITQLVLLIGRFAMAVFATPMALVMMMREAA